MNKLHLEIISPEGILFKDNCHMVVVPSIEGDLGLMHGHQAVIAVLREGKIEIFDEKDNLINTFEVAKGIAQMQEADKASIILD